MSFDADLRFALAQDLDKRVRQQRGRDRQNFSALVYRAKAEEQAIEAKMPRAPRGSEKWWHLLGQLNISRRTLLDAIELTDSFDPRIGRAVLGA